MNYTKTWADYNNKSLDEMSTPRSTKDTLITGLIITIVTLLFIIKKIHG